jgi:hypothetical protein
MPKKNPCIINEYGRMSYFKHTSLLAIYLKIDNESVLRWRRRLVKENKPMIWSYQGVLIEFKPTIYSDKDDI